MWIIAQMSQVDTAVKEFHRAADTWGLTNSVLLTILIAFMCVACMLAVWIKPKLDAGFVAHMALVKALTDAVPDIKRSIDGVLGELKKQTDGIGTQTAKVSEMACKLDELPSDFDKVCRIEQAMLAKGFPPKTIERAIRYREERRKRKEHKGKETDHG